MSKNAPYPCQDISPTSAGRTWRPQAPSPNETRVPLAHDPTWEDESDPALRRNGPFSRVARPRPVGRRVKGEAGTLRERGSGGRDRIRVHLRASTHSPRDLLSVAGHTCAGNARQYPPLSWVPRQSSYPQMPAPARPRTQDPWRQVARTRTRQ